MAVLRDQEDLVALCGAAGEVIGVPASVIEKDYWVTQALRALQLAHPGEFIFKGGTSLSKAYGLIERFSEDVDLLVVDAAPLAKNKRYRRLKKMCDAVASSFDGTVTTVGTPNRDGLHRSVQVAYGPSLEPEGAMLGHIRLDVGILGGVEPYADQTIDTLIVRALSERRPDLDLDGFEDLRQFTLPVLHPGRTLVEKLVLVHTCATAAIHAPELIAQRRVGRHFYDIHCLLGDRTTMSLIRGGDFDRVLEDAIGISRRQVMDDFYFGADPYPTFADVVERVREHDGDL